MKPGGSKAQDPESCYGSTDGLNVQIFTQDQCSKNISDLAGTVLSDTASVDIMK